MSAEDSKRPLKRICPNVDDSHVLAVSANQNNRAKQLVPREFKRLSFTFNPQFISKLVDAGILGFAPPFPRVPPTVHYYEINVANLYGAFTYVFTAYITCKVYQQMCFAESDFAEADAKIAELVTITVDACMAALYAKLRTIHTHFQDYSHRYPDRPTYHDDIELPLPFADAIENFGKYVPHNMTDRDIHVPTYPENTQNEGRSTQFWSSHIYESCVPYLKELGIPVKSVNTTSWEGSPWWTYKVSLHESLNEPHFDLACIFAASNYSDHSAMVAGIFAQSNAAGDVVLPITEHPANLPLYPVRLRGMPPGFQTNLFAALCHAPQEERSLT